MLAKCDDSNKKEEKKKVEEPVKIKLKELEQVIKQPLQVELLILMAQVLVALAHKKQMKKK
ncbi:hypothetical protein HYE11_01990 [Mycoplasmopsis bovis]|nr:hypothetical protein HYE11_01990 [Mycoplasmopsis bovis]